jgi:hypothetical protein
VALISILGNRFNNLQSRIEAIYGDPSSTSSTTGYGNTTRSYQVAPLTLNAKSFNAATAINYTNKYITITGHAMLSGDKVEYDPNGNPSIIGNLYDDAHYWVQRIDANTIKIYYDEDFTRPVDLVSGATGIHILNQLEGTLTEADAYFRLYLDIAAARVHQKGTAYTVPNNAVLESGDTVEEQYITDLETLMTDVEADKFLLAGNQAIIEPISDGTGTAINSTRTTPWGGAGKSQSIVHEFNVNYQSTGSRTGFFNAGGDIRFFGSLTGGSGTKSSDWTNILRNAGTTTFSRTGVSNSGSIGSVTAVTPYTLTTTYQLLYSAQGASYTDNYLYIYAKFSGTSTITFKVEYADLDDGGAGTPGGTFGPDPIDEDVNGTIKSQVTMQRPTGQFTVGGVTYASVAYTVTGLNISTL